MHYQREEAEKTFLAYTADYDPSDPKIRLKIDHTFRVARLCETIAASLGLSEEDTDLAYLSGLLHDIGRFEQIRRYGTFIDRLSCNHAALSADLLFKEGLLSRFLAKEEAPRGADPDISLLEKVIRLHNVYILPKGLTEREGMFCRILRDADKVDILRVNVETPIEEIYDIPLSEFRRTEISEEILTDVLDEKNTNRDHARTPIDYYVGHIALVFGIVYPESIRQARNQGWLDRMLDFHSELPETEEKLDRIRKAVHGYIERRAKEQG